MLIKLRVNQGFPGGAVVGSLPASAGDAGSSPGLGGSRMPRSGWAREPQLLSLRVWRLCSATGEPAMVGGPRTAMRSGPHLLQLERALARKRRPNTAIKKKDLIKLTLWFLRFFSRYNSLKRPHYLTSFSVILGFFIILLWLWYQIYIYYIYIYILYIYIYRYTHTHTHTHTYIYIYIYVYIRAVATPKI